MNLRLSDTNNSRYINIYNSTGEIYPQNENQIMVILIICSLMVGICICLVYCISRIIMDK
jgi:hypothetical protein